MYNKVIMVGNLTRDIELKYLPSGSAVAKSAIATSYRYKTQTGEQKEEVCFLDFNVFGKSAEILNQYVRKGSKVLLEGRLVLESWVGSDGNNRSKHSLRVDSFKFLDSKSDTMQNQNNIGGYNNQGYSTNQTYQQPTQNNQSYNQNIQNTTSQAPYQQNQAYQSPKTTNINNNDVVTPEEKIPEIDINEDEIPF